MISVEIDNKTVLAALDRLQARAGNLRPALFEIGERLAESTYERFNTGTAPDGSLWALISEVTKQLSAKRGKRKGGPLVETGVLQDTIEYQLMANGKGVMVGTNRFSKKDDGGWDGGAAIHQFGGKAGRGHQVDIPARPFLGLSADDEKTLLDIVARHLEP